MDALWYFGGAALVFALAYVLYAPRRLRFHACPALLTRAEQPFYRTLKRAADGYDVCPKVRVADIIDCDPLTWRAGGWRIATWHIDFVLIDARTAVVKICIELDDKSHAHPKRRARDAFLNSAMRRAGVRLLRIPLRRYTPEQIRAILAQAA